MSALDTRADEVVRARDVEIDRQRARLRCRMITLLELMTDAELEQLAEAGEGMIGRR